MRGYVALVQDSWDVSPAGLKQARAYYQHVFFENQWIESFQLACAKFVTQLALDLDIGASVIQCVDELKRLVPKRVTEVCGTWRAYLLLGIPIFVLKVACAPDEASVLWSETGKCVELRAPQHLDHLLRDLMQVRVEALCVLAQSGTCVLTHLAVLPRCSRSACRALLLRQLLVRQRRSH